MPTIEQLEARLLVMQAALRGYVASTVPPWAGTRAKTWQPHLSLYNGEAATLRTIRTRLAAARAGRAIGRLTCLGDSKTAGYGTVPGGDTGGIVVADSYPGILRDILGARDGIIYANINQNTGVAGIDTRWSAITGFVRDSGVTGGRRLYLKAVGASSLTLTTTSPATALRIVGWSSAAATVTVTVDGGAGQTWNVPVSNSTWRTFDLTGLSNGVHTVTVAAPDGFCLLGVETIDATADLRISNAGICATRPSEWKSTATFSDNLAAAATGGSISTPSAVLVNLGTNWEATSAADIASIAASLKTANIPTLLVAPGGIIRSQNFDQIRAAAYDAADTNDFPLIDLSAVIGDYGTSNSRGMNYDVLHENPKGYWSEAAAVARVIAG